MLVPLDCESAATMLALGADEIQMGPMAFLTAVDTSIVHDMSPIDRDNDRVRVGTNELQRIIALWEKEKARAVKNPYAEIYQYIHPLVVGAVDRAGSLSMMLCNQILSYHVKSPAVRKRIAHRLNNDYPSHGYPIVLREAERDRPARRRDGSGPRADADRSKRAVLRDGPALPHRLRRAQPPRQREVVNIHEMDGRQIYFQVDKDWHYRQADRTWVFSEREEHLARPPRRRRQVRRGRAAHPLTGAARPEKCRDGYRPQSGSMAE